MANEGDAAQAIIERDEEIRNKQIEFARNQPRHREEFCLDCDVLIPQARHDATGGSERCTSCESIYAQRNKVKIRVY